MVHNQNSYYRCSLKGPLKAQAAQRLSSAIRQKLESYFVFRSLVPGRVKIVVVSAVAHALMFVKLENIDQRKLFSKPLSAMPRLSHKLRRWALVCEIALDKVACVTQIAICKYAYGPRALRCVS